MQLKCKKITIFVDCKHNNKNSNICHIYLHPNLFRKDIQIK